jgi:hypothetical protein
METSIEVHPLEVLTFEVLFAEERDRLFTSLWLITALVPVSRPPCDRETPLLC